MYPAVTMRQTITRELQTLPEEQLGQVLAYVRLLRVGLLSDQELRSRFTAALARAQAIAQEQGITEADIDAEIQAVRAA